MLVVGESQKAFFDAMAGTEFANQLDAHLSARQPGYLPRFPAQSRKLLVGNMMARAQRYGLTWKSTITLFCDLMQSAAPNFDRHPRIQDALAGGTADPDVRMRSLPARVPAAVWDEIAGQRVDLPLYVAPDLDDRPLEDRVAHALPIVLWDHIAPAAAHDVALWTMKAAASLGLDGLDDAPLAVAAMQVFYLAASPGKKPDWLADVRDPALPPKVRLELLRLKIALDHGRRV